MPVLKKSELTALLKVPTSISDARMIKQRNQKLLEILDKIPTTVKTMNKAMTTGWYVYKEIVDIGCPHCINCEGKCECCAYRYYPTRMLKATVSPARYGILPACLRVPYGNISADEASEDDLAIMVEYDNRYAILRADIAGPVDPEDMRIVRSQIHRVRKMLLGHIEWAEAVIDLGGVGWPDDD